MSLFPGIMVNPASIGDIKTVIGLILERGRRSSDVPKKKGEGRSYSTKVSVYSFKRIRNHFDERNGIMDKSANTRNCINNVTTIAFGTSATASYWPEIRKGGLRQNQLCCISRTRLFQNQDKINFVQSSIYPATPPPMRADTVQIMIHETLPKTKPQLRKA